MPRINERISECVSLKFSAGPRFRTESIPLDNGDDVRNRLWQYPKQEYSAEFVNFSPDERDEVLKFQYAAGGSWLDFRFRDWMDYQAINESIEPEIGTSTPVQFVKTYTKGAHSSQRIIQAIVAAVVFRNGAPVAGTYDDQLGIFTPDSPWEAGTYTWSGEFDVWVHFAEDYNPFTATDLNHWSSPFSLVEELQR